ncbi:hypothetical protein ACJX0J_033736, partial [Zea mays]
LSLISTPGKILVYGFLFLKENKYEARAICQPYHHWIAGNHIHFSIDNATEQKNSSSILRATRTPGGTDQMAKTKSPLGTRRAHEQKHDQAGPNLYCFLMFFERASGQRATKMATAQYVYTHFYQLSIKVQSIHYNIIYEFMVPEKCYIFMTKY